MTTTAHAKPVTLVQKLADRIAGRRAGPQPCMLRLPVEIYTDQQRFEQEQQRVFHGRPLIIGHESQIPVAGDAIVYDWLGLPLITLRDNSGGISTFMNVCRHRGMRLVQEEGQTCLRSMVCPYHQWTYGLDGSLRNIPRDECFVDLDMAKLRLRSLPTEVRQGLIWMLPQPDAQMDLDKHMADLGEDLQAFDVAGFHFCKQNTRIIDCNWKLIQDAFLDGYHVTRLHKNTVGAFFPDAVAESDVIGEHVRSAIARNEIAAAVDLPPEELDTRHHTTFSYTVFPNTIIIFHPDYTSIIGLFPVSPDQTIFTHTMLTPKPPASTQERDHFHRSFDLVDQGVFQAEDIFVSEGAQRGMRSGANNELIFGGLEEAAIRFHRILEQALA